MKSRDVHVQPHRVSAVAEEVMVCAPNGAQPS